MAQRSRQLFIGFFQWVFLVPERSGRDDIPPYKAIYTIYTCYIRGIYCQLDPIGWLYATYQLVTRTRQIHWFFVVQRFSLRTFQQTPGAYPKPPTNSLWFGIPFIWGWKGMSGVCETGVCWASLRFSQQTTGFMVVSLQVLNSRNLIRISKISTWPCKVGPPTSYKYGYNSTYRGYNPSYPFIRPFIRVL